jgi:DNA-binding LacI/PurR family transcriptional regulator
MDYQMNEMTELISRKAKNKVIADVIRKQITSGELSGGERLLSDSSFARKFQVNERTVASGLNILVNEGLLERIPRRGTFVVNHNQKGRSTSNAVGMIMFSKGDVYSNINRAITRRMAELNLYPVLISDHLFLNDKSVKAFMRAMISDQISPYGFVIDGSFRFPFNFLKQHLDKFHNLVFINKYHHPEKIDIAKYATVDFAEAGRTAARHFISKGYKKLICLGMHEKHYMGPWSSMQVPIIQGFAEVCKESDVQFNEDIFWKLLHGAPLADTLAELLSSSERPDAIFSYNDAFMRYEIMPLLENDKDIDLIGFYNTHHAEECNFSSICIKEEEIAKKAIDLLTNKINQREVSIKPELVVRN